MSRAGSPAGKTCSGDPARHPETDSPGTRALLWWVPMTPIPRIQLGAAGPEVSAIALGAMRYALPADAAAAGRAELERRLFAAYDAAWECGINMVDHADIYAGGRCEELFGQYLRARPGLRDRLVIQTKCGIRFGDGSGGDPHRYDHSRAHIVAAAEGSLRRLGCGHLDVLLLHRPDCLVEPEEVAAAVDDLHRAGKVRFFGVSNHSIWQIELLRRHVGQPLVANQLELNLRQHVLITDGMLVNIPQPATNLAAGLLDYCRLHRITVQPWCPVAREFLPATVAATAPDHGRRVADLLAALAAQYGVAPDAVQIAWLLRHPARLQPLIGTTRPERVRAQTAAAGIALTREDWYALVEAIRGKRVP